MRHRLLIVLLLAGWSVACHQGDDSPKQTEDSGADSGSLDIGVRGGDSGTAGDARNDTDAATGHDATDATADASPADDADRTDAASTTREVLWALDPSLPEFGFDGLASDPGQSTSAVADPTFGTVVRMQSIDGFEQHSFGGHVTLDLSPCAESGAIHFRYLVKYGDTDGEDWWSGDWADGGFEFKAWDLRPQDVLGRRVILAHRRGQVDGNTSPDGRGTLHAWIRWEEAQTELTPDIDTGQVVVKNWTHNNQFIPANVWTWIEVSMTADGALTYWWAPYDGTGTEYSQASPQATSAGVHDYNFSWFADDIVLDYGYKNHDPHAERNWYYGPGGLVVHCGFVGPISVTP